MANNPAVPAVSVIIPVYNAEKTLRECLDGVLGQTLKELEIICVDDGSADGSAAILEEYRARDPRIRVLHQENSGAGTARNAGLEAASGEYLAFLDADDRFEKDMLQAAFSRCRETGADLCAFAADSFDANTGETASYGAAFVARLVPETNPFDPASPEARDHVLQMFNGVPWSKLFRAGFIRETGLRFQPLRTTNDAFFVYSALCKARKIVTMNRILVHRRKNDASSLTQTRDRSCLCFCEALVAIREELIRSGLFETFERTFANRALQNIIWNAETVSPESAARIAAHMQAAGFRDLGLDRYEKEYFYDPGLYERLCWMRDLDPGAFRTLLSLAKERDRLRKENLRLEQELETLRSAGDRGALGRIRSLLGKK